MGKIIAEKPELRRHAKEIARIVAEIVKEINSLSIDEQKRLLEEKYSWVLERRKSREEKEKTLPPLPGAVEGKVVTRFAPNPDFAIHLGNARPAILSYEYKVMYKGRFILRFEDTDPRTKTPLPEAYEAIREDLKWLGLKWDEEYIQSLRMSIYYDIARKLLERGCAYVDDKPSEEFRKYRNKGLLEKYPPRLRSPEENLELWDKMLQGYFDEGQAVLRIKTDPRHPDPSIRDWVAFRIINPELYPHPIVGDKYTVWPTYNLAAGVDDHLMGVTHILRAKEHMQNTEKQKYVYNCLGWKYPDVVHFGRLKLEGFIMSKSTLKKLYEAGAASGFDDPRFATIAGLRRRGFSPEAIRQIILEVGVKYTDASISFANLAAINRSIIDNHTKRIMAVINPVPLLVEGLPWSEKEFNIPFHPNGKLGSRPIKVKGPTTTIYISSDDLKLVRNSKIVRLMEAFNIEVVEAEKTPLRARFHSLSVDEARKYGAPIIQWVPSENNISLLLMVPEGLDIEYRKGVAEEAIKTIRVGEVVQFVRIGFARIDSVEVDDNNNVRKIVAIYSHA
ncbi:glutamate--tRNA ligase [Pyrofollis japonicus]|nr:glutamate--tRNA ligase [Pyrofollis japonicus]